jgi:hypothetical protein
MGRFVVGWKSGSWERLSLGQRLQGGEKIPVGTQVILQRL